MMRGIRYLLIVALAIFVVPACDEGEKMTLPSVEERVDDAISNLRSDLTAPTNGWKLEYQPTVESGVFFMLLDFREDGTVRIKSDVADNEGEFFDRTITWRVDNALGLELILETYGVFHYMFEQDNATFGAEFEFIFEEKETDNLVFRSKSDVLSNAPKVILEPASGGDENLLARDIADNLNKFATISPKALEDPVPRQEILLENFDISVFWSLDPAKRIIQSSLAKAGEGFDNAVLLGHQSGYQLQGSSMVLKEPLQFILDNTLFTINSVTFSDFSLNGPGFCLSPPDNGPEYKGQIPGLGPVSMTGSLFDLEGTGFQPVAEFPYSVNSFFIFDENEESLSDEGKIIAEKFPEATGFVFYYGFVSNTQPANAVGFILEDDEGNGEIFVREFQPTSSVGNKISIVLTDNYFHSGTPQSGQQADLAEITDLLFDGGDVYAFDFPVEDVTVFKLFNPCNQHEMFLVR